MTDELHMDSLYPEIARCGSVGVLLRGEFERIGSPLKGVGFDESSGGSVYWAAVRVDGRGGDITVAKKKRLFLAPFWVDGVEVASLKTDSVDRLVRAVHAWVAEKCSVEELKAAFPEVCVKPEAAAYEEGPAAYVEFRWTELIARVSETSPRLLPVVRRAHETPALRRLLPFTSLDMLCFSRCTGYPFTRDCPWIGSVGEGWFRVTGASGERLGEGDAETAVRMAVENLPVDCGAAGHGTRERYEG